MNQKAKITALFVLLIMSLLVANIAFAEDAPPSIDFEFGDDGDTPPDLDLNGDPVDDGDTPPNINFDTNNTNNNNNNSGSSGSGSGSGSGSSAIRITEHDIFPKGFNPLFTTTTLTFTISEDAVVEVNILNSSNKVVATLMDDEDVDEDEENKVTWDGKSNGAPVTPGTYTYEIIAKDDDLDEEDTEKGTVQIIYATDFEDGSGNVVAGTIDGSVDPQAVLNLQHLESDVSNSGPGVFLYFLFPALGYLTVRIRR